MDRRGVIATLCATVLAGGITSVIGAAALPDGAPYFTVLITFGVGAIVLGLGGLLLMLLTAAPTTARAPTPPGADHASPPAGLDEGTRAIWLLRRARNNAAQARKRRFGFEEHHRALSEMTAAILGVKKQLGVGGLLTISENSDDPSYRDLLLAYVTYADSFLPLLESNQIETAQKVANSFTFSRGLG